MSNSMTRLNLQIQHPLQEITHSSSHSSVYVQPQSAVCINNGIKTDTYVISNNQVKKSPVTNL